MSNPQPPRKASWRNAAGQAPATRGVDEAWRKKMADGPTQIPWWRKRWAKLAFVLGGIGLVAVTIIVLIILLRPQPPFGLVMIGAGYEDNLAVPHNVPGVKGLEALRAWADVYNNGENVHQPPLKGSTKFEEVKRALQVGFVDKALKGKKPPKTLVVFVSAHGVARVEGGNLMPYLVPEDYTGAPGAAMFPLDDLLGLLENLEKTKKVLILDCTQVGAHWPLGIMHSDFARALQSRPIQEHIARIPNLVVIGSSSSKERSWAAPEWGQTAFAHYVLEGLKGEADKGKGGGNGDGGVSAAELYHYVKANVQDWTRNNRARLQTPVFLFSGKETSAGHFEVVSTEKARRAGEATAHKLQEQRASDAQKAEQVGKDLVKEWQRRDSLAHQSPHPAVYAPHLWRLYLDRLLRAEQLNRWGEPAKAEELVSLAATMKLEDASLKLPSSQMQTLAMPAALGRDFGTAERQQWQKFLQAWQQKWTERKNKEEQDKADTDLAKAMRALMAQPGLRTAAMHMVLGWVADKASARWAEGRKFVVGLEDKVVRPAECHYQLIVQPPELKADQAPITPLLKTEAGWALLARALKVQLRAEAAALGLGDQELEPPTGVDDQQAGTTELPAYSEQVLPWLRQKLADADAQRRLGQDLLFSSEEARWKEAADLLDRADTLYKEVQADARLVRQALEQRDRALAELPYYTRWLAELEATDRKDEDDLLALWSKVHALNARLDERAAARSLAEPTGAIKAGLEHIHKQLKSAADGHIKAAGHTQAAWHEIEAALAVPFLPAEYRKPLWDRSADISRDLDARKDKAPPPGDDHARLQALRQAALALAVLGLQDSEDFKLVLKERNRPEEDDWFRVPNQIGAAVEAALNRLPENADQRTEEAAAAVDLGKAATNLKIAAQEARQVEGAAVGVRMKQDPIGEQRRLQLHDLLCWQAERSYLGYWAEWPQQPGEDYFQKAGKGFLDDAVALVDKDGRKEGPRLKAVAEGRKQLSGAAPVVVCWSASGKDNTFQKSDDRFSLVSSSKQARTTHYRLEGPRGVPGHKDVPGHPVRWVKAREPGKLDLDPAEGQRPVALQEDFTVRVSAAEQAEGRSGYDVHGYFRGHQSHRAVEVAVLGEPDIIWAHPPLPVQCQVAVQTKGSIYDKVGVEKTAIALVLDCSGSMRFKANDREVDTKYEAAVKALKTVVGQLPDGVKVSLHAFGAESFGDPQDKDNRVKQIWEPHEWTAKNIDARMAKVKNLKPYFTTPLIRGIWEAHKAISEISPPRTVRTIVVLTDGADNYFYHRNNLDRDIKDRTGAANIQEFLESTLKAAHTHLIVIGYPVDWSDPRRSAEDAANYEAEQKADKEFRRAVEAISGQYLKADNNEEMERRLTQSLFTLPFELIPQHVRKGPKEKPEFVSRVDQGENLRWVTVEEEGTYDIRFPPIRSFQRSIYLKPGDSVLLDLDSGPSLRRALYSDCRWVKEPSWFKKDAESDWVLAALEDKYIEENHLLQLMTILEKKDPGASLRQEWPAWVWFDVSSPQLPASARLKQRFKPMPHRPAPAWDLAVRQWPGRQAPTVHAWWTALPPQPLGQLKCPNDFDSILSRQPRQWPRLTSPSPVVLESVELKEMSVEFEPDKPVANCLVITLQYSRDDGPYFVRLPEQVWNDPGRGQEHRFYLAEGKYVGIFCNVTQRQAAALSGLDLFSVAELKKNAASDKADKSLELLPPGITYTRPSETLAQP
jgi:hypothetical protein